MRAVSLIKEKPHYRSESFLAGLRRCGYQVVHKITYPEPDDVLVIWNRSGLSERLAHQYERRGARVLVAENGYAGRDAEGRQFYALAKSGHNGSGWWPVEDDDRFSKLRLDVQPFRTGGDYVVVCGQRGIGSETMRSPPNWHDRTADALKAAGNRVVLRPHPGNRPPLTRLDDDLARARACIIWSSACGVQALLQGIPVVYHAPHWVCEDAASRTVDDLVTDDNARKVAFHRMAWAQWSVDEIESGEPFKRLLA